MSDLMGSLVSSTNVSEVLPASIVKVDTVFLEFGIATEAVCCETIVTEIF